MRLSIVGIALLPLACAAHQAAIVAPAGATRIEPKTGLEFIALPGGTFHFGCEPGDEHCREDELPGRSVTVRPMWVGRTEVTVDAYARCVRAGACRPPNGELPGCTWNRHGNHPVNCLDWYEAKQFCEWIGGRLPTAEEWEFAAKGGEDRIYPWGESPVTGRRANYADKRCPVGMADRNGNVWMFNSTVEQTQDDGYSATAPVGSYPEGQTPQGLRDMAGNVWEWTASNYDGTPNKEIRGGGWLNDAIGMRASMRAKYGPASRLITIGMRCAM